MKSKFFNSKKVFLSAFLLGTSFLFAQENIRQEDFSAEDSSEKNFVIIESKHSYNLNPRTANYSAEAQILTGLYEGLFSYDPITLDPVYAMVKNYRISRDKKRWTFELQEGIKFSDGEPITAETVRSSLLKAIAEPGAPFSSLMDIVNGAEEFRTGKGSAEDVGIYAMDSNAVSIHLKAPASHLPKILCMPAFAVTADDLSTYSGPFCLEEYSENRIILKKNKNYHDAESTKMEKITILLSNDADENVFAYNTGAADWIASSFNEQKLLSKDSIHLSAEFATQYFFFKFTEKSVFNNLNLRRALLEATPWNELRANTYVQAQSLVYALNGYPSVEGYSSTDIIEAKILMDKARNELKIEDNQKIKIRFAITDTDYMKKKAELLKKAWEPLGVELETVLFPEFEYLNNIEKTDADLFSYNWIGDFADPLAFLELFRGNSTMNVSGWNNKEFNAMLDEAALYTDENHNRLLAKAEQLLLDEAVIFPIQHPVSVNIINLNEVGGWALNAFDIHPLKYLFKRENFHTIRAKHCSSYRILASSSRILPFEASLIFRESNANSSAFVFPETFTSVPNSSVSSLTVKPSRIRFIT